MLAKFQGVLFKAEKINDMPGYRLYNSKTFFGSIFLDTNMFMICNDPFELKSVLKFNIDPKDFELLDYEIVTNEWVKEMMESKGYTPSQLAEGTNTSLSSVSGWLSEEKPRPISGSAQASLYNFLAK